VCPLVSAGPPCRQIYVQCPVCNQLAPFGRCRTRRVTPPKAQFGCSRFRVGWAARRVMKGCDLRKQPQPAWPPPHCAGWTRRLCAFPHGLLHHRMPNHSPSVGGRSNPVTNSQIRRSGHWPSRTLVRTFSTHSRLRQWPRCGKVAQSESLSGASPCRARFAEHPGHPVWAVTDPADGQWVGQRRLGRDGPYLGHAASAKPGRDADRRIRSDRTPSRARPGGRPMGPRRGPITLPPVNLHLRIK